MKKLIQKLAKLYVSSGQQERDKKIIEASRNFLLEDLVKQLDGKKARNEREG